jgi:hypothetical protein
MITVTIVSISVTVISILFGLFGLLSERKRKRSFDEYSNEIDKLINHLTTVTESMSGNSSANAKDIMSEVLRSIYHANLFTLKKNIVKAALMWLWENGTKEDIEVVRRATDYGYIRSNDNRTFARFLVERLSQRASPNSQSK